jgi:capsular exopolysaccharide synthesis family protein
MNNSADQFWTVLWRRRIAFLATFVVVMVGVAAITFSLPKVYSTSSYLLVSTLKPTGGAFEAQQVSQVDTQTVAELLQTRNAANIVASSMPYRISPTTLQGKVSVTPVASTNLVLITAKESTPARAQQLANTYATVFTQQAASTITSAKVSVAAPAALITNASAPRPKLYLLVGAILALLAATGVAFLRQRLDQHVVIRDFATELFGLPILARVPNRRNPQGQTLAGSGALSPADANYVEGFRLLFANLTFVSLGDRPSTIAVLSAGQQDGKSTVSAAIAQTAAEMTDSVLLVDGDLRRPTLSERLNLDARSDGLSNFLARGGEPLEMTQLVHDLPATNLHFVGSGTPPPNPSSLLGLPSLEDFLLRAKNAYDFVVIDTPPVSVGADASLIAARVDAAVLVVDSRTSRRTSVEWALRQLSRAHVNVLGIIVNRVSSPDSASYYYQGPSDDQASLGRVVTTSQSGHAPPGP